MQTESSVENMRAYRAKYVMGPDGVIPDGVLTVNQGRIVALGTGQHDVDLGNVVLAPGLVNAHSHAFQRVIRGRTEFLDAARPEEDFWSWRTLMYQAAGRLNPDSIEAVVRA